MVKRALLLAVLGLALAPATAAAAGAAGATLTVPSTVTEVQGQPPSPVPARLSYPGLLGACGGRVGFTWDGRAWASDEPAGAGLTACEASVAAVPPAGAAAGTHRVCASNDITDACASLSLVIQAPAPPAAQAGPAAAISATTPSPVPAPSPSPTAAGPTGAPSPGEGEEPATPAPAGGGRPAAAAPDSPTGMLIALGVLLAALAATALSLRSLFGGQPARPRTGR